MGISNTVGYSIPGFVAPTVVDVITKHVSTPNISTTGMLQ